MSGYDPPSLAPLLITPEITAAARANQAAARRDQMPASAPHAHPSDDVEQLAAMFPDYDREVLSSVLAAAGNMELAVQQLLEMGGAEPQSAEEADDFAVAQLQAELQAEQAETDEELALRLFRQFADDLSNQLREPIPQEVRDDPVRYEQFIRQQFERELLREGSQLSQRAESLFSFGGSGSREGDGVLPKKQGLLDRMKKMPFFTSKVGVEDGEKPLLLSDQAKQS